MNTQTNQTTQVNTLVEMLVASFAKSNKINKAKTLAFAKEIIASANIGHKPTGRPMLDKTKEYYKRISNAISLGINDSVSIREIMNEQDKIKFNNALHNMEKQGIIKRIGKVQTGKQGRQPNVFTLG